MIIPEVMKNLNKDIKEFCDRLCFKYSSFSDMDTIANIVYSGMLTYSNSLKAEEEFNRIKESKLVESIESEAEEPDSFGVDCDNCSNTICSHTFCNIYSVPTSFKKGPGYCKYFTKISK